MSNKLFITTFLFIGLQQMIAAQTSGFHFGISVTPYYTNAIPPKMFRDVVDGEFGIAGISAGLFIEKQLHERWSLRLGGEVSTAGADSPKQFTSWPSENMNGTYQPDPALPKNVAYRLVYRFVDLPLQVRYAPKPGKPFFLCAGTGPVINLNNKLSRIYYYQNGDEDFLNEIRPYSGLGYGARLGAGWQFPLVKNCMLELRPEIRVTKLSLDKNGPRYYQLGLQLAAHI